MTYKIHMSKMGVYLETSKIGGVSGRESSGMFILKKWVGVRLSVSGTQRRIERTYTKYK